MEKIKEYFEKKFNIPLPEDKSGLIKKNGWVIRYLFENGYMEYYASHRMTDDSHYMIYDDGRTERLEAINSWCGYSEDPEKNKEIEKKYFENNRRIYNKLKARGLME